MNDPRSGAAIPGYFADPDEHLWEVAYNPHFPFDTHGCLVLPE